MKRYSAFLISAFSVLLLFSGCKARQPVRIGLLASFSGPMANIGIDARTAALLALDDFQRENEKFTIEIIEYDDQGSEVFARLGAKKLIGDGVAAIIGPFTSQTTIAAMTETEKAKVLLLSPTAADSSLLGKNDYLIRMNSTAKEYGSIYADQVEGTEKNKSITILADFSNKHYTQDWISGFTDRIRTFPGEHRVAVIDFNSQAETFTPENLSVHALKSKPESIIVISEAFSTALILQQIRKLDQNVILYSSEWAVGSLNELIAQSGSSLEGVIMFSTQFIPDSRNPKYLGFVERYTKRFGSKPNPMVVVTYEAFSIVFQTLAAGIEPENLAGAIINGGPYQGIQQTIEFDEFGDRITHPKFQVIGGNPIF